MRGGRHRRGSAGVERIEDLMCKTQIYKSLRSARTESRTPTSKKARLLLDRRSLVQVPNAPRRRARADDRYYEENIMESYFLPEGDHRIGPGP